MTEGKVKLQPPVSIRSAFFLMALIALGTPVFAHRPYETPQGGFMRGDGVRISVVKYCVDGIMGNDPCDIQFRTPDGSTITNTAFSRDEVFVRILPNSAELFEYSIFGSPIATSVRTCDGFGITTTSLDGRRLPSISIHVQSLRRGYISCLAFIAIPVLALAIPLQFPKGMPFVIIKVTGAVVFAFSSVILLLVLFAGGLSPLIFAPPAAIFSFVLVQTVRFFSRRLRNNSLTSPPI